MTAAALTAPLDVLKTRLQSDFYQAQLAQSRAAKGISPHAYLSPLRSGILHFRETFQILGSVHRLEGYRALFKGLGPNLVGVVPARSINFFVVGNGKRIIADYGNNGQESAWVVLCAAAIAGIVTSTATNPIWLIKTRLQLDRNIVEKTGGAAKRKYKNSWDCIKQVVRNEGIRGLYKGMSASYLGVTESAFHWVLYEQMKKSLAKREERIVLSGRPKSLWDNAVEWTGNVGAAGSAKLVAALATYPHEVSTFKCAVLYLANKSLGRPNSSPPSTHGKRPSKIHWPYPMLQAHLERRRDGGYVRRAHAPSFTNSPERSDHVWHVRGHFEVATCASVDGRWIYVVRYLGLARRCTKAYFASCIKTSAPLLNSGTSQM